MIKCCLEESGLHLTASNFDYLTAALFEDSDTSPSRALTFDAMRDLLGRHAGLIDNVTSSIDSWLLPAAGDEKQKHTAGRSSLCRKLSLSYVANNAVSFTFLLVFLAVNLSLFVCRLLAYRTENYFVAIARACGTTSHSASITLG